MSETATKQKVDGSFDVYLFFDDLETGEPVIIGKGRVVTSRKSGGGHFLTFTLERVIGGDNVKTIIINNLLETLADQITRRESWPMFRIESSLSLEALIDTMKDNPFFSIGIR